MKKKKRRSGLKKVLILSIFFIFLWIFGFYLYTTYNNIEINNENYETTKLQSTAYAQTVENV